MKKNNYWKVIMIGAALSSFVSSEALFAQSMEDILNNALQNESANKIDQEARSDRNYQNQNSDLKSFFDENSNDLNTKTLKDIEMSGANYKGLPGNNKISDSLRLLMNQEKSLDSIGFEDKAFQLGVEAKQQSVYVTITTESATESKSIEPHLKGEFISQFENTVYALMPISELEALAENGSVYSIEPQAKHYLTTSGRSGNTVSEGIQAVNVSRLHKANITGKGIKIGILDFGFERYNELQQKGEVPAPIDVKVFNNSGKLENGEVHGTACAEIIHDMAPDAQLFLAAAENNQGTIIKAAFWLAEQGVDIISYSIGGVVGPRNGTALMDKLVEHITEKYGVLWVSSAGNEGEKHLPLKLEDKNGNQLIDIFIENKQTDFALIKWHGEGAVFMVWDDWGQNPSKPSSTQDLDMFLYKINNQTKKLSRIASSENRQNGRASPLEVLALNKGNAYIGTNLLLVIINKNASRPVKIHLNTTDNVELYPTSPIGSIKIPATSQKALAVGAVDVRKTRLELYSSQGPTDDGRMKPNVSAPDKTLSVAYGKKNKPGRFPGTSAACPHVSGFAALLSQHSGITKPQELLQLVEKNVRFLEGTKPNNRYGKGYITAQRIKLEIGQSTSTSDGSPSSSADNQVDELQRTLNDILGQ